MKAMRIYALLVVAAICPCVTGAQKAATAPWALRVTGDVPSPLTLTETDFASMPQQTVEVTGEDGQKASYEGVSLQALLAKAGISFGKEMLGKALASYVLAEASDGYSVLFSMGELADGLGGEKIIVADKREGKQLAGDQGPTRLVVPGDKEGARSVRMLETLEVVELPK